MKPERYQSVEELVKAVRAEIAKVEVMVLARELRLKFKEEKQS